MASNYQVSPLDSNKSILMVLKDIQKYLKDNPIYKVYFCNTNFVPDTLVYNLSDIDIVGLSSGDVVFFKNTYYAKVESVGDTTFTILEAILFKGVKGDKGDTGAQGIQGAKGDKGDTGAQGIQGEKGEKGDTGAQGVQGEKGENGVSITNVTSSQSGGTITLTFTYSNGTSSTASYTATGGIDLNTYAKTFNSVQELDNYIRANIDKIHKITFTPNVGIKMTEYNYIQIGADQYTGGITQIDQDIISANLTYDFTPHLMYRKEESGIKTYVLLKHTDLEYNIFVYLYPNANNVMVSFTTNVDMLMQGWVYDVTTFINGTFKFVMLGTETNS